MASDDILKVRELIAKQPPRNEMTLAERRAHSDKWDDAFPVADDFKVAAARIADVPVEWIGAPTASDDAVLMFLHGGGYVFGSPRSHRHLVANLSEETGLQALLVDYRLAPEHPFPAAVEDALSVYASLLTHGYESEQVVLAGDSAGGGLVVSTMLAARDENLPLPAAGVCLSPWTDLTGSGASLEGNAAVDPTVTKDGLADLAGHYLGAADAAHPYASPSFGELAGLPPLLIHVGSVEVLLDDAVALDAKAREAGVDSTLEVWDEMIHVWHRYYPMLREAREANARVGEFVRSVLNGAASAAAE